MKTVVTVSGSGLLCIIALFIAVLPVIWLIYIGIYTFDNPDSQAWYGISSDTNEPALFSSLVSAGNEEKFIDIHGRYVNWFLWAFLQSLAPWILGPIIIIAMFISPEFGSLCGIITFCGMSCSWTAWFIAGILWRFRKEGAFACGDGVSEEKY